MRHRCLLLSTALWSSFALAACGGRVTVQVLAEGSEGQLQPQRELVVRFLPFDRDSIFDVLTERAEQPEPVVPQDLREIFDSVSVLQERWREADSEWSEVRDQLRQLSDRLQRMDPRSRDYRQLYDQFLALEQRERRLDRVKTEAFNRFTNLQNRGLARLDSVRAVHEAWADIAFRDYFDIVEGMLEARGRKMHEDTTSAEGIVTRRLPRGGWWVHTRLPVGMFDEYYWNVRIDPAQVDTLRLTPENAHRRLRT